MKTKVLKAGFGYLVIVLLVIGTTFGICNMVSKEMAPVEEQQEVPLQNAVGENEVIAKTTSKKKVVKKKVVKKKTTTKKTKKKTTKKVSAKKYTKSKVRKVSTPKVSTNVYQNYAHNLVINTYGWSEYDFQCLVKLWNRESGWKPYSHNDSSGAHGIPQAKPGNKMRSEGKDWRTNGYTQIRWGLKYIKGRYGSPAKAWAHSQRKGWY